MIETRKRSLIDRYGYIVPEHYGLVPWHGAVATFRPGEGPNGLDAIAVEEATENACSHRIAMGIDGWHNKHSMVEVIESPTPSPFGTGGVLKVSTIVGGTINSASRSYIQMKSSTELTNVFSASVFVKSAGFDRVRMRVSMNTAMSTGGANVNAVIDLVDGSVLSSGRMGSDVTPPNWRVERFNNGWFRIIADNVVFTGPGAGYPGDEHGNIDGPVIGLFVWDSEATEGDGESGFYVWGPQVETKPFSTSFTDGVRGPGVLGFPTSLLNSDQGTIMFSAKQHALMGYNARVVWTQTNNRFGIHSNPSGGLSLWYAQNQGTGSTTQYLFPDTYSRIVTTWVSEQRADLFINGDLALSLDDVTGQPGFADTATLYLGSNNGSLPFNGLFSEFVILPYAASPAQIASWGGPEKPLPIIEDATLQWGIGGVRVARTTVI